MRINFRKIKGFIHQHRLASIIIGVAIVIAVGTTFYFLNKSTPFNVPGLNLKEKPKETKVPAPFTGILVDPSVVNKRPLAVVIENSPDARPQSGYNEADFVYETLAEGGITRTLAIFHSQTSKEIGPVRSARPYFIDWLSEINAIFAHVGGSVDAFDAIAKYKVPDLNQFYNGNYFWRSTDRFAPHNVYTTTEKLYAAAKNNGLAATAANLKWFSFKKDADSKDRPAAQKITVNFSGPLFVASYDYDPATNDYKRSVGGVLHKDKNTGVQIRAKNVVIQYESITPGVTRAGEQKVNIGTIGEGKALVFQDGKAIKATWKKTDRESLTTIKDEDGFEIKLNPGQTWFEVIPVGQNVNYQ